MHDCIERTSVDRSQKRGPESDGVSYHGEKTSDSSDFLVHLDCYDVLDKVMHSLANCCPATGLHSRVQVQRNALIERGYAPSWA